MRSKWLQRVCRSAISLRESWASSSPFRFFGLAKPILLSTARDPCQAGSDHAAPMPSPCSHSHRLGGALHYFQPAQNRISTEGIGLKLVPIRHMCEQVLFALGQLRRNRSLFLCHSVAFPNI